MSVLQTLQQTAGQGNSAQPFNEGSPLEQDLMMKMQANPVPGQSLTQDPANRAAYEKPPEHVDIQEYVEEVFLDITDPQKMPKLLDVLRNDVPIEYVTEQYLQRQFQQGKINPDLMMMAIEPTMYMMMYVAAYGGVDAKFLEEENMDDGEALKAETEEMNDAASSLMNVPMERPDTVSPSLLKTLDQRAPQETT